MLSSNTSLVSIEFGRTHNNRYLRRRSATNRVPECNVHRHNIQLLPGLVGMEKALTPPLLPAKTL